MSMSQPHSRSAGEIGDRRLRARQDDEVGVAGQRAARRDADQLDVRLGAAADRDRRNWRCAAGAARRSYESPAVLARRRVPSSAKASSAGSRARVGEDTAPGRAPASRCARAMRAMPSSNRRGSPRNLLTMKPAISAASSGSSTAFVPTRLAITPPRSMSPTSTTGTSAARAKPMLAMSLARRLISDADAGAFDQHEIGLARSRAKLSSTDGSSSGFTLLIFARLARCRARCPAPRPARRSRSAASAAPGSCARSARTPRGARLQRLRAADLAAVGGDRGVVRHVLRLERPHLEAARA